MEHNYTPHFYILYISNNYTFICYMCCVFDCIVYLYMNMLLVLCLSCTSATGVYFLQYPVVLIIYTFTFVACEETASSFNVRGTPCSFLLHVAIVTLVQFVIVLTVPWGN